MHLDLTGQLKQKNELHIKILPVPKKQAVQEGRWQAASSVKPAVSYGWDFHPRLIPSGIWDETGLEIRQAFHMEDVTLFYVLNELLTAADITVEVNGSMVEGCNLFFRFLDDQGRVLYSDHCSAGTRGGSFTFRLDVPRLWWPHDHGRPYLYCHEVDLADSSGNLLQTLRGKMGFRRVKLVMNHGGWDEPRDFPKTRSVAPVQLEINGKRIFCKGSNWVPPEIFPGIYQH